MSETPGTERSAIVPVILAAGDSSRMGFPKALLPYEENTFVGQILHTLKGLNLASPVLVLGKHAAEIQSALDTAPARIVCNHNPEEGQLSSIRLALQLLDPVCEGCLVWPVDQPGVSQKVVLALIDLFLQSQAPLALPTFAGKRGHPAIFRRSLFPEFIAAPLDEGPKRIILSRLNECALLPTSESATVEDMDTPADYYRVMGTTLEAALAKRSGAITVRSHPVSQ
jgi:molybdenum cofactor cytidylyltransferase